MIGLMHYFVVATALLMIGLFGVMLNRHNLIIMLMSLELILLAVTLNFTAFSWHLGDLTGQVFALFIFTIAAAESVIGLAILVAYFRQRASLEASEMDLLRG